MRRCCADGRWALLRPRRRLLWVLYPISVRDKARPRTKTSMYTQNTTFLHVVSTYIIFLLHHVRFTLFQSQGFRELVEPYHQTITFLSRCRLGSPSSSCHPCLVALGILTQNTLIASATAAMPIPKYSADR